MSSYKTFLNEELARRQQGNPAYSQRAFARQMGLSPGELSEILSGKRPLSFKSAMKISKSLGLNPTEVKHLVQLIHAEKAQLMGQDAEQILAATQSPGYQLSLDLFRIVSDWYCFAILNLSETIGFRWDIAYIAKRLKITMTEAKVALERLQRVGLIEEKNGRLVVAKDYVLATSGIPSEAIRNFHRQILQKAIAALDYQKMEDRDITGITLAIDSKFLASIKKDISDFQEQLAAKYSRGKKNAVYHLENALFKLTEGDQNVDSKS